MRRSYNFIYPLFFAVVVAFGMLVGIEMSGGESFAAKNRKLNADSKFNEILNYVNSNYVDTVNSKNLTESAINGLLKELDPHSTYVPAKRFKRMNSELKGNFEGIGIEFNILQDTIVVVSPIEGGPSEKLGIQSGDKIIKVEGDNVAGIGITNQDVIKMLRGEKGTKVDVTIKRPGKKEPFSVTITRDKIPIHSVTASYMVDDRIGYIKVNRFSQKTFNEFEQALTGLSNNGMEGLILDLRGNPGGILSVAKKMADEFLESGKMIVYTEGRKRPKRILPATRSGDFESGKLVILIDEGSASASEIVSGAVQDHDRGLIIGRRSFGKAFVQERKKFTDGSALRLTVARYYTPTGRCIQKPYKQGVEEYRKEIYKRYKHGEFIHKDSIDFADSLKYKTPNGRTVYGGGGIMPDIFVPLDTVLTNSKYLSKIQRKGLINQFALQFVEKYREGIDKNYPSRDAFIREFKVEGQIFNQFKNTLRSNGLEYKPEAMAHIKEFVMMEIKGLIGRQYWEDDIYYEISNKTDKGYQKAISVMNDNTFENSKLDYQ